MKQPQLAEVRAQAALESPVSVGATMVLNAMIEFALATEARIIADTNYVSRDDVEEVKQVMHAGFAPMIEIAADDMAQMTFQGLVALQAAVMFFLAQTARPLPRMLEYAFHQSLPSLVMAYRLYADAGRADEMIAENKAVHPAFMQPQGRALSS
jgi:prophage DNA circulation protein